MICSNCGNNLEDNAKFCPKCGNPVSAPNAYALQQPIKTSPMQQPVNMAAPMQQPVNMAAPMQQPAYSVNPANAMPRSPQNNVATIILGVAVAVLIFIILSMQGTISSLEGEVYQYKRQIADYENRNSVDKTIDAIGSWLE